MIARGRWEQVVIDIRSALIDQLNRVLICRGTNGGEVAGGGLPSQPQSGVMRTCEGGRHHRQHGFWTVDSWVEGPRSLVLIP